MTAPVPVNRLVRNVEKHLETHPDDARAYFVLGRLHSLAFARPDNTIDVITNKNDLPGFAAYQSVRVQPAPNLDASRLQHLAKSIENFQRATELNPTNAIAFLGLAWVLDQALQAERKEIGSVPFPPVNARSDSRAAVEKLWNGTSAEKETARAQLRKAAVDNYRKAYDLTLSFDLKQPHIGPAADEMISLEAGQRLVALLRERQLTPEREKEIAEIDAVLKNLQAKPRAVTPIIFSFEETRELQDLLAPNRAVPFDLAGDGERRLWPWVKPGTGILVWDPMAAGSITSGLQLFGSVTWWIFWENGYTALAALDNDTDGWLTGDELRGLAVWQDKNQNAVSDLGEVISATKAGICRIAVHATTEHGAVASHPAGIEFSDGRRTATFDWTPVARSR